MPPRRNSKEYTEYQDRKLVELYESGYALVNIAERFGCDYPSGIQHRLRRAYKRLKRKRSTRHGPKQRTRDNA